MISPEVESDPGAVDPTVKSFWYGAELTTLERLCIASFVKQGFTYQLYVYEEPAGLPNGVVLCDAGDILPRARVFRYAAGEFNLGSVAGFSNLFRYTLLYMLGGLWVDTDLCCVNPFDLKEGERFFQEVATDGSFRVASALLKAPAGSAVLRYCLDEFAAKDTAKIIHAETGPELLTVAVNKFGKQDCVLPADFFFPVFWWEYERLFYDEQLSVENCSTVHFWNSLLSSVKLDKNAQFPANSVFEKMKRRYL